MAEKFRWRSDMGVTDAGGGKASAWQDQISGLTLLQPNPADQPDIVAGNQGNIALRGDGVSKAIGLFSGAGALRANLTNFPSGIIHVHGVVRLNSLVNRGRPWGFGYFTPGEWHMLFDIGTNRIRSFINKSGSFARNGRDSADGVLTAGTLFTVSQQYQLNTNNHFVHKDGVNIVSSIVNSDNVPDTGGDDGFAIFAVQDSVNYVVHSNCEMYDLRIFDGAQDPAALHAASLAQWDTPSNTGPTGNFNSVVQR